MVDVLTCTASSGGYLYLRRVPACDVGAESMFRDHDEHSPRLVIFAFVDTDRKQRQESDAIS